MHIPTPPPYKVYRNLETIRWELKIDSWNICILFILGFSSSQEKMCYLRGTNLPDSEASNIFLWQEDGKKLFPAFKEKNSRLRIRKHSCQTPRESNCLGHLKRSLKLDALHMFSYLRSTKYCRMDIISLIYRLKNWEVTYPVQGYTAWVCECQSQDTQLALDSQGYTLSPTLHCFPEKEIQKLLSYVSPCLYPLNVVMKSICFWEQSFKRSHYNSSLT